MLSNPKQILCISPSMTQRSIIERLAVDCGLRVNFCAGEAESLIHLDNGQRYNALVIAHELADGDSLQVIESVRSSLVHATLPVAFVMAAENPDYAFNALRCGATEVFLATEYGALGTFLADCVERPVQGDFSGRVLLLEDSASHAAFVCRLMEALGLSVDVAHDVEQASQLYAPRKYLIVIADVVLKNGKSGISFVRRLRQDHAWRQPVLMMSGFDDLPRRLLAIKSGADDFLSKPFSPEELVWRMKKVLNEYVSDEPDVKSAAHLRAIESDTFVRLLSPREKQIFDKVLEGSSDRQIAAELKLSYWTVRGHIQQVFRKTGAVNRQQLMARFLRGSQ